MPIKVDTKGFDTIIQDAMKSLRKNIVMELEAIGEKAVEIARTGHGYTDQTGNLTSSIGYIVVCDGVVARTGGFKPTDAPNGKGAEGVKVGTGKIDSLVSQIDGDYALILVAGMEYASFVEAMGKNVLDGAMLYAIGKVPERVKSVVERSIRGLNKRLFNA